MMTALRVVLGGCLVSVCAGQKSDAWIEAVYEDGTRESTQSDGSGGGTAFGPASKSMSIGWWAEDLPAWGDLKDSRFVEVPGWLVGATSMVPGHRLKEATEVIFHCPSAATVKHPVEICNAYVFLYRCPPCQTDRGNLESQLLADGWSEAYCGPKFKTGADMGNGFTHRMEMLHKQYPVGTTISFTTSSKVAIEYIAFGNSDRGADCGLRTTEHDCKTASLNYWGVCNWDSETSTCKHGSFCPRPPRGPCCLGGPGCKVCPNEELLVH